MAKKAGSKKTTARKSAGAARTPGARSGSAKPAARAARKSAATKTSGSSRAKVAAATSVQPRRSQAATRARTGREAITPTAPAATPDAVESQLSDEELEQFRVMLLDKRRQLVGDVGSMQGEAMNHHDATGNLSSMPLHMADVGTDNFEQELTLELIGTERALIRDIDDALQRLEAGTYGICAATGRPISKARLRAMPWTKYCYEYTIERERRQERGI